jgi:hypothetical protein
MVQAFCGQRKWRRAPDLRGCGNLEEGMRLTKKEEKSLEEENGHGRRIPNKASTRKFLCPPLELF